MGLFIAIPLITPLPDNSSFYKTPISHSSAGVTPLTELAGKANLPAGKGTLTKADRSNRIDFTLLLAPRNKNYLQKMSDSVSSPGSPYYRKYITPAQFGKRFGAAPSAVKAATKWLLSNHLRLQNIGQNRLFVEASGTAPQIDRAFHTEMAYYKSNGNKTLVNLEPIAIDKNLSKDFAGITGLDNLDGFAPNALDFYRKGKPGIKGKKSVTVPGVSFLPKSSIRNRTYLYASPTSSCAQQISASGAGLQINKIAQAYSFDPAYSSGDTGQNTTVALIEFAPIRMSDINYFASCYGLPAPQINQIPVHGGPGGTYTASGELEAELDTEMLVGLAPGATVDVYEGPDTRGNVTNATAYAVEEAAVNNPKVKVISTSWGGCEQGVGAGIAMAESYLFEQSALEGQTWVAASGDTGSTDCYGQTNKTLGKQLAVDDPSSQPFVTGVGGTTLSLSSSGVTQTAWNTTLTNQQPGAGGGGVSLFWTMPGYQYNTPRSLNVKSSYAVCPPGSPVLDPYGEKLARSGGHKLCREVPDVSANAGTPVATYCSIGSDSVVNSFCSAGGWTPIGGTSAAAPIWAAVFALADSSSACQTAGPVGFANPLLYKIASGQGYASAMTDVTTGGNDLLGTDAGYYLAGKGYSPVTGLGTPLAQDSNGQGLIPSLCNPSAAALTAAGLPTPEVTKLLPDSVRARGGGVVRVEGVNFSGSDVIYFGNKPALSYRVVSAKKIIAVAPPEKGRVHITVISPSGKSLHTKSNTFSFLTPPVISGVGKSTLVAGGLYRVQIRGNYFYKIKEVLFGTLSVRYKTVSAHILYAFVPVSLGKSYVRIKSEGGTGGRSHRAVYNP